MQSSTDLTYAVIKATARGLAAAAITALAVFSLLAHAVKMDITTHDMVIERLEMGLDGLENKEARPGILLRLADLYADRARLKAMDEVQKGCSNNCNKTIEDRKLAIQRYQESLPYIDKEKQGTVVLQIAHLQSLNGQQEQSKKLYQQIVNAKIGTYSSRVRAMAYSALAEKEFRAGNFKQALNLFNKAKQHDLKNKGFVEYRIAWCLLNLRQEAKGTQTLVRLLSNPVLLATQTTDGNEVDVTFADDVSADLALFLARGKVRMREIDLLRRLSSDKARRNNLKILAEETDRQGKKNSALAVWAVYVDEGDVKPMEKLEVQVRVAQIFYDLNKQDLAANAYEKAMSFWKKNGCTEQYTCDELKTRVKKFVTAWNKAQKDKPSKNVFRSYVAYLSVFNDDAEMFHWAAIVGRENKRYNESADLFHSAAILAADALQKAPHNKSMSNIFEGSLLAEIEMAEETKDFKRREQAYNWYLKMNPKGDKAFEVRYQRAHLYYDAKNLTQAYSEFNELARTPGKSERDLKVKSADLALDCLVAMKNDQEILTRSQEYSQFFPERKSEYTKISRTASFNLAEKKSNDAEAALAILAAANMKGASTKERITYLKNKIVLAQKARKLEIVKDASQELLTVKPIDGETKEYAFEQLVWVNELQLNFQQSYRLTQKMELPRLSRGDKLLRLALLAELAGESPRQHYEQYLRTNRDERANNLVRVTLIKNSNYSWREIDKHFAQLKRTPDLLAPLVLEAYANDRNVARVERIIKSTRIAQYPAGRTLARHLAMRDIQKFDREIKGHQLLAYNDVVLKKTLQQRLNLIAKSEKNVKWAINRHDWTLQMLSLSQLARENRRLYSDLVRLPIPAKLKGEDRERYKQLLTQQSKPYEDRADQIDQEIRNMWDDSESVRNIETVFTQASPELQRLYKDEVRTLSVTAPSRAKNRLDNLLNTPYRRPSRSELMVARRELQSSPWDERKVQHLRDLESQSGRTSMVAYLDARLNELKKRKSL